MSECIYVIMRMCCVLYVVSCVFACSTMCMMCVLYIEFLRVVFLYFVFLYVVFYMWCLVIVFVLVVFFR